MGIKGTLPITHGGTGANSEETLKTTLKTLILDMTYPVGSIYISTNNISPAIFLGGIWEQIEDTFLLAASKNYIAGNKGGSATITEVPEHTHKTTVTGSSFHVRGMNVAGYDTVSIDSLPKEKEEGRVAISREVTKWQNSITHSGTSMAPQKITITNQVSITDTGSAEVDIMPPYLAVYMWKRTK